MAPYADIVTETVVHDTTGSDQTQVELLPSDWRERVRRLAEERDAVILAHNYQLPEIQDVAHHTGDSMDASTRSSACG
jgi:quinolinate synthase